MTTDADHNEELRRLYLEAAAEVPSDTHNRRVSNAARSAVRGAAPGWGGYLALAASVAVVAGLAIAYRYGTAVKEPVGTTSIARDTAKFEPPSSTLTAAADAAADAANAANAAGTDPVPPAPAKRLLPPRPAAVGAKRGGTESAPDASRQPPPEASGAAANRLLPSSGPDVVAPLRVPDAAALTAAPSRELRARSAKAPPGEPPAPNDQGDAAKKAATDRKAAQTFSVPRAEVAAGAVEAQTLPAARPPPSPSVLVQAHQAPPVAAPLSAAPSPAPPPLAAAPSPPPPLAEAAAPAPLPPIAESLPSTGHWLEAEHPLDEWLLYLRGLMKSGRTSEARALVPEFQRRFPRAELPEELRPLRPDTR